MTTSYPSTVDSFVNPTSSDTLNSATVPHAAQHDNLNDAVLAIETELGTLPKGSSATVKARLDGVDTSLAATVTKAAYRASWAQDSYLETISRLIATGSVTLATGQMRITSIVPFTDTTISNITFVNGTTGSASLTLARFGLYAINGSSLQLVARTASDTTIFNTVSTAYTRALDTTGGYPATYTLTAGTRYYVAIILVGTTPGVYVTTPTLSTGAIGLAPAPAYLLGSLSDLPTAPTIASLQVSGAPAYSRLT